MSRTALRTAGDWLSITRPVVSARVALTAAAAAFLAGGGPLVTLLAGGAGGALAAGIYTLDDLFDRTADSVNHPQRALVQGRLNAAPLWAAGVALTFGGALLAGLASPPAGLFTLGFGAAAVVEQRFQVLQRWWLTRGLALTALVFLTVLMGALMAGAVPPRLWALASALAVPHFGGRVLSDLPDVAGDRLQGLATLPAISAPRSRRLVTAMLRLSAATLPVPSLFGFGPVYLAGALAISAYLLAYANAVARGGGRRLHLLLNWVMGGIMLVAVADDVLARLFSR